MIPKSGNRLSDTIMRKQECKKSSIEKTEDSMIRRTFNLMASGALLCALLMGAGPATAQGTKIVAALPGIPPIFSVMIAYIADKQGIFKKYGIDIEIRPFDNGTAAARAVVAGDADISWSPTPPVINQISNANVPLVAVYGMPNPDWVIGTTESGKACKDIAGQEVGVDSVGGARSVALRSMLAACPGVKIEDTKQVGLGGGAAAAMIAGRLQYGVLHLDDIAEIEAQGKKLAILMTLKETDPTSHYLMLVVRKDNLAAKRDAIVRATAAMIEAARFMNDPKNIDKVAEACMITGHSKEIAKAALKQFLDVNFWATKDDGLPRSKLEATAALMKKIGAINADKQPVTYENLVDTSVWKDANAMVK
jgi:ABC-type nitrate/sulfonate/bicarbonate transport system substrate-binding protein